MLGAIAFRQGCINSCCCSARSDLLGRAFLAADDTRVKAVNGNKRDDAKRWQVGANYIAVVFAR
jgi:hypothetical protein